MRNFSFHRKQKYSTPSSGYMKKTPPNPIPYSKGISRQTERLLRVCCRKKNRKSNAFARRGRWLGDGAAHMMHGARCLPVDGEKHVSPSVLSTSDTIMTIIDVATCDKPQIRNGFASIIKGAKIMQEQDPSRFKHAMSVSTNSECLYRVLISLFLDVTGNRNVFRESQVECHRRALLG